MPAGSLSRVFISDAQNWWKHRCAATRKGCNVSAGAADEKQRGFQTKPVATELVPFLIINNVSDGYEQTGLIQFARKPLAMAYGMGCHRILV
jgi:hypothetical protein